RRIVSKAKSSLQYRLNATWWRRRSARHHRDRIVRTLSRAIEATDTRIRIDVDIAERRAKDRARRTARQTFRIGAVHADLRHECVLKTLPANRRRPLDLNASPQQTRLPVHLVTGERAVAATYAKVHVHDEDVSAIDDAGSDLFFCCFESIEVGKCLDRKRQ